MDSKIGRVLSLAVVAGLMVSGCPAPDMPGGDAGVDASGSRDGGGRDAGMADGGPTTCTSGCLVGTTCTPDGMPNPGNPCQICDVARSRTAYSAHDGAICDDGMFCTSGDVCSAGSCTGTPRSCDDGIACDGTERCDEAMHACHAGTSTCTSGQVCDATSGACVTGCSGCVVSGTCYGNGQPNPLDPCTVCDVSRSMTSFSSNDGGSCDDGLFCTSGDVCHSGMCAGVGSRCNDGVACDGVEMCDETMNRCIAALSTCATGMICDVGSDTCVATCTGCVIGGTCFGSGQRNPSNQCELCDPARSRSAFSSNAGATCDDGLFCTNADVCTGTTCGGTARVCSDGIACNGAETCDETTDRCAGGTPTCTGGMICDPTGDRCVATCGGCAIGGTCYGDGQVNPTNSCEVCRATTTRTAWSANDGASCDDGMFCTDSDVCSARACAGSPRTCGDGVACNGVETCDEARDRCVAGTTTCSASQVCDVASNACITTCSGCIIGGVCYASGTRQPGNPCFVCTPPRSPTSWSDNDGASCDDGLFCTRGDVCSAGLCSGTATNFCVDAVTCNGTETCNETTDRCQPGAATCGAGQVCDPATPPGMCVTACSGCVIGGVCFGPDSPNPSNGCQICRTSAPTVWSPNTGASCNDGAFCTGNDTCSAAAVCAGTVGVCDDGVSCNGAESCDESADRCDPGTPTCAAGQTCDPTLNSCVITCAGCVVGGVCYRPDAINPANDCQACTTSMSRTAWSPLATGTTCNDGHYCTVGETCNAGSCGSGSPRNCSDGITCNGAETCNAGTDACQAGTSTCGPGTFCDPTTPPGTCAATCAGCLISGICYAPNTVNTANQCQACLTGTSTTTWTNRSTGTACNDGRYCTVGETCTTGTCGGGSGRDCSDGITCNGAETCSAGTDRCVAGTTTCTTGSVCDPTTPPGTCVATCAGCLIGGVCYAPNTTNPTNQCQQCVVASSTSAWTNRAGACDDGNYCNVGEACSGGTCTGGSARNCSDSIACNGAETCNMGTSSCQAAATTCTAGFLCNTATDMCVATCSGTPCGGSCVDTAHDPQNCGGCSTICSPRSNTAALCGGTPASCQYPCLSGFLDCNGGVDGCEVAAATDPNHCGICSRACPGTANGFGTCAASTCGIGCNSGYQDNDGNGTCRLACAAGTCSGHGSCVDTTGTAVCTCTGGYSGSDCSTAPIVIPGLAHCWGGEGNGIDVVGGANATVNPDVTYATGRSGSAFHCGGVSGAGTDVVSSARPAVSATGPWTYELWIRRVSSDADTWILDRQYVGFSGSGTPVLPLHSDAAGNAQWFLRFDDGVGGFIGVPGTFALPASTWVHVAFVRSGATFSIYANGALVGSYTDPGGPSHSLTPDPLRWCGFVDAPVHAMTGEIDSIRIWSRALSATEIATVAAGDGSCTAAPTAVSCNALHTVNPALPSGTYAIDPDGASGNPPFSVTCDMTTSGGGWTVISSENFESGESGWSSNLVSSSCISYSTQTLCGYNLCGVGASESKTYSLLGIPHTTARVALDYYSIDSWDNEQGFVQVDGADIFRQNFLYSVGTDRCGGGWLDRDPVAVVGTPAHSTNSLTVLASSTLDQTPDDESWAIDNVLVMIR